MERSFKPVALAVVLDGDDWFPYDERYLFGPAAFGKPALRWFTHEVIHLWQLFGSGYLSACALGDWRALLHWEATGEFIARDLDPDAADGGFAPNQLHEALCRYWDVHILGPATLLEEPENGSYVEHLDLPEWMTAGLDEATVERAKTVHAYSNEQYDRWMLQEDRYAEPYRLMLERFGSYGAAILFPIVGYFAMQTPKPPTVYLETLDRLRGVSLPLETSIHDGWRRLLASVANVCGIASVVRTGCTPTDGFNGVRLVAEEGNLVYRHYAALLDLVAPFWPTDVVFALPGDPQCRLKLVTNLVPPVALLRGGRWEPECAGSRIGQAMKLPGLLRQPALADEAAALCERWRAMDQAALLGGTLR